MLKISDLKQPFNLRNGWLLWAGIGLGGAIIAIALTGAALTAFNGEPPQREVIYNFCIVLIFILYLRFDECCIVVCTLHFNILIVVNLEYLTCYLCNDLETTFQEVTHPGITTQAQLTINFLKSTLTTNSFFLS